MDTNNFETNDTKRFRKFCVQTYTKILKPWISCNSNESNSEKDTQNLSRVETNLESQKINETIYLNSSLESIPETPEIVQKRKDIKMKKNVNKRLLFEFIDFESEVAIDSTESFCDDIENTQKELDDNSHMTSLIDDTIPSDTQPIGKLINGIDSRCAKDMETVYLRSIKDQIGKTDKFKLQYNYDPNIEVYSQELQESDLESYELNDFCVSDDFIEYVETSSKLSQIELEISSSRKMKRKKYKRIIFKPD